MILSGPEIEARLGRDVVIEPYDKKNLNPNSYNLRLHNDLMVYTEFPLDMKRDNPAKNVKIPNEGLVLEPGRLYLGRTIEYTETQNLVPMLEGRSSVGRLGLFVHVTAGFGDTGFAGYWTLEMHCIHPVRVYAGVPICQIFYHTVEGEVVNYASGKYQKNREIQTSRLWMDFVEQLELGGND
jgi:dCTP deaminase